MRGRSTPAVRGLSLDAGAFSVARGRDSESLPTAPLTTGLLPCSSLRDCIQSYCERLRELADSGLSEHDVSFAYLQAEFLAVSQLRAFVDDVEYRSCANSPFFSGSALQCNRQETLNYAAGVVRCITQSVYGRYVKVLMLFLLELRFRILIRDARFFAEHHHAAPSLARMRGEFAASQVTEQQALMRAFQLIDWRRYRDGAQMQTRRNTLGKGKASSFAKELRLAYEQAVQALIYVKKQRQTLHRCRDLPAKTHELAAAVEKLGAAEHWIKQRDNLFGRLASFQAAHSHVTSGTDVAQLCDRLRVHIESAFTKDTITSPATKASETDKVEMLKFFMGSGGEAVEVETALASFFNVVERMHERAPELWAINFLFHWYGVEEGMRLARDADVVDGGFKQQCGGVFEKQFFAPENRLLTSRILVPHCCDVTRCDEATAEAWVDACFRRGATGKDDTGSASPTWPGMPPAAPPPEYRLARNVNYRWGEAGSDQVSRTAGELDGVIYDAATCQVLFVLEAKQNIADVGKACMQKERLYKALDAAWAASSRSSPEAMQAGAQQPTKEGTTPVASTVEALNATPAVAASCAASTRLRVSPVELHFFVTSPTAAETASEHVSFDEGSPAIGREADDATGFQETPTCVQMAAAAAPRVCPKTSAASSIASCKPLFTQDNFAAFSGTSSTAAHSDATESTAAPVRSDLMLSHILRRDQRWVYLTCVPRGNSSGGRTAAPAPGGTIHAVELTLVVAACDSIAEAYDRYLHMKMLPSTATPALHSLLSAMLMSSAYLSATEPMTPFQLALELPPPECLSASAELAMASVSNPYEYVLQLYRHEARCKDGSAAVERVRLRENFIDGLVFSEQSLIFAVNTVAKQMESKRKGVPSFCDVLQMLMQQGCVRNLVMAFGDEEASR
ncbi:hypothetical protein GH5_01223 [Leishmania sp. Ghana 2012 LV757]|uniref:hypothetical protein n=1 Tax=Leishmania sp. Ghana 2012 LV757 TaxID=2803181 RepID=UPI001B5B995C|nr:hypothetical protein GH5_01223 [Leishmania sp. Ghana 2012 LV757]